ncbi:MAG TPA: hypothetical protein PKE21_13865 [Flavobacteriales bacterium]|nr:hypothetical protein [Flavobacteriales bacterium]HMR28564.1 hypothetical protein [Flavobacteriales bacterium]
MSERVQKALRRALEGRRIAVLVPGKVTSVDGIKSCDVAPADGGAELVGVRLRAAIDQGEKGMYLVPKVGSPCVVAMLQNTTHMPVLISADDIERIVLHVDGDGRIEIEPGGLVKLNGDDYGGVIKWDDLKSDLDKLKNFMQAILQGFQSWSPVSQDGGAALKAVMAGLLATQQVPQFQNITSTKTKHGSGS